MVTIEELVHDPEYKPMIRITPGPNQAPAIDFDENEVLPPNKHNITV